MYENKKQPLASATLYYQRTRYNFLLAAIIIITSLFIGLQGYNFTVPAFYWYDNLSNSSMILNGMAVVDFAIVLTKSSKLFACFYALHSGIIFLSTFGVFIAPVLHRFFLQVTFR